MIYLLIISVALNFFFLSCISRWRYAAEKWRELSNQLTKPEDGKRK